MANVSPNATGPNANYIPLARIGSEVGCGTVGVGCGRLGVGSARVFRYQDVGIGNAKVSRLEYCPTLTPNARVLHCSGI